MKFWIAMEPGNHNTAWGVVVPDLPGCHSAGDSADEVIENARAAIDLWCQTVIEDGGVIPPVSSLETHQANPHYSGWVWGVVDVPVERYLGPAEKINITLPRVLLARVDDYAHAHGESRSGLLARAVSQLVLDRPLPRAKKRGRTKSVTIRKALPRK